MNTRILLSIGAVALAIAATAPLVLAATSAPQRVVYNGHLLSSSGSPVTTAVSIRFSYWKSADKVDGDVTGTGAINIGASNYAAWQEVQTVTPDSNGYFSVELGSATALPNFSTMALSTLLSLYMQVEVKASTAGNTSYELLDRNPAESAIDRSPVESVPFALNADFLDQREIGTGSGAIPLLGKGGNLLQGGTLNNRFTIDTDNSSGGTLYLRFGDALGKELSYEQDTSRFNFNDDVRIQGDLTVTGLINGVDISQLSSGGSQTHLQVSSGAGLTINIAAGDYRLGGNVTQYAGGSNIAVTNNATNNVFFGSGGLTIRTSNFPGDESYIALATVVTSGGAVSTISDRRVFNTDDRETTITKTYAPAYDGAAYKADGSDNVGQLSVTSSGAAASNHYVWTSTRSTLQDYDIIVHATVSPEFVRWTSTPLLLKYRTTTSNTATTKADITVTDTAGNTVSLTGNSSNLASTDWTTANVGFAGTPTWTTGSGFLIKIHASAKDNQEVQIGHLRLNYVELPRE